MDCTLGVFVRLRVRCLLGGKTVHELTGQGFVLGNCIRADACRLVPMIHLMDLKKGCVCWKNIRHQFKRKFAGFRPECRVEYNTKQYLVDLGEVFAASRVRAEACRLVSMKYLADLGEVFGLRKRLSVI